MEVAWTKAKRTNKNNRQSTAWKDAHGQNKKQAATSMDGCENGLSTTWEDHAKEEEETNRDNHSFGDAIAIDWPVAITEGTRVSARRNTRSYIQKLYRIRRAPTGVEL